MDKIFEFIEERTGYIVMIFLAVVIILTISVPIYHSFQEGNWIVSYENNGQIGDFFGGILNPLIAFLALIWIAKGVKMQKQELEETKKALEESARAQHKQANASHALVQLNALAALLSSLNNDELTIDKKIYELEQMERGLGIPGLNSNEIDKLKNEKNEIINIRKDCFAKVQDYLEIE